MYYGTITGDSYLQGMVNAAAYIYKKVKEEHLLTKAFNWDKDRGTQNFHQGTLTELLLYFLVLYQLFYEKCFKCLIYNRSVTSM